MLTLFKMYKVMICWNMYMLQDDYRKTFGYSQTLMAESEEELKSLLMKVKEESEKAGLKLNI